MRDDLRNLLDDLDAAHGLVTAELPWRVGQHYGIHVYGGPDRQTPVGTTHLADDAAAITAAVNNLPRLTAAVRAVLDLADADDDVRDGYGYRVRNGLDPSPGDEIRAVLTAALEPDPPDVETAP